MKEKINLMIKFCRSKLWAPYIWGANGPNWYDCSGLIISALKSVGWFPDNVDMRAQDIYHYLSNKNWIEKLEKGSIVFFGKSKTKITHVGIALDHTMYISAAGGDKTVTTVEKAQKRGACVKITDIRKDLVASLYPIEEEAKNG